MKIFSFSRTLILGIVGALLFVVPQTVSAAIFAMPECYVSGNCSTCDLVELFVSISNFVLLSISGVVIFALAFGGFMWIYAAGNQEKVQKGVKMIFGAITGLIFVLTGWVMVNVAIAAILGETDFDNVKLFEQDWSRACRDGNRPTTVINCTDQADGTMCEGGGCTAESCACMSGSCVTACVVYDSSIPDTTGNAFCISTEECTSRSGTPIDQPSWCASGTVCCFDPVE